MLGLVALVALVALVMLVERVRLVVHAAAGTGANLGLMFLGNPLACRNVAQSAAFTPKLVSFLLIVA
ncbi:hypothetical protein SAMN05518855_102714 [Paenibacillus sp. CF384]|nr:hypothetical protein SAMN05518855_102714 [Paenibacillus sp. CF384]